MATIDTHTPETSRDGKTLNPAAAGLGDIAVRRDVLQARTRAEAFLLTVRAVQSGIAAVLGKRRDN